MSRDKLQRKSFLQPPPFMNLLLLCAILIGSLLAFQLTSSTAHAASLSNDPLVTVSIDKTQGSSCTEIFQANIGTPQAASKQISCAPGTIMSHVIVHRSQALAQHLPYVVLPSLQASNAEQQQAQQQIHRMDALQITGLRAQINKYVVPATACGQTGNIGVNWNYRGGQLYTYVTFYKSTDCSTVGFNEAAINTNSSPSSGKWLYDYYAGRQYNVPNCPFIKSVGHYFHLVSQSAPAGYYYEPQLDPDSLNQTCGTMFATDYINIGPIQ